jgi:putative dimethyl sulfoxide reductase chaperone
VEELVPATLATLVSNRASMYSLLARIYRVEVDQGLLDQMARMDLSVEVDDPEMGQGYRILQAFLGHLAESAITDLAVDFARVFLGAGLTPGNGAFPFESVYTSPGRLLMQEARDQVVKLYKEEGLGAVEGFNEPEDHIAIELDFMGCLCRQTLEALTLGDKTAALGSLEKQSRFLEKHLLPWAPAFCADVQRFAQSDFYKASARITVGYLGMEQSLIGELIEELKDRTS